MRHDLSAPILRVAFGATVFGVNAWRAFVHHDSTAATFGAIWLAFLGIWVTQLRNRLQRKDRS